jgi:hypothetical protein
LEGKPKPNKGSHSSNDPHVATLPGEKLHVDIVFVMGRPRLFAVDEVSGYCSFLQMDSKSTVDLNKAFEQLLNAYQGYMKVVRVVSVDAESNLFSCSNYLNSRGVKLERRIPGEHEKVAERAMRVVRERMRVKLIELPFALPRQHHDYLAAEVIRTMNMLPNSKSHPLAPESLVCGNQINLQSDLSPPFGSAVLCPVASASHSTEQKQEMGVCMGKAPGTRGGVQVYLLNGREPVTRRALKPMPMVQYITDHMNELAADTVKINKKKKDDLDNDYGADPFHYSETIGMDEYLGSAEDFYRGESAEDKFAPALSKTLVDIDYSVGSGGTIAAPRLQIPSQEPAVKEGVKIDSPPVPVPVESIVPESPQMKGTYKPRKKYEDPPVQLMDGPRASRKKIDYSKLDKGKVYQMTLMRALESEHADAAREAAKKELKQLVTLKTWVYLK